MRIISQQFKRYTTSYAIKKSIDLLIYAPDKGVFFVVKQNMLWLENIKLFFINTISHATSCFRNIQIIYCSRIITNSNTANILLVFCHYFV